MTKRPTHKANVSLGYLRLYSIVNLNMIGLPGSRTTSDYVNGILLIVSSLLVSECIGEGLN